MTFFNKKAVVFVLTIGIAVVVAFSMFYFRKDAVKKETTEPVTTEEYTLPGENESLQQATTTPETKTYRNEEWGFEFEYPTGWTFHENTFYSLYSKFNLVGASPEENNHPNPLAPSFLINVVTPDFADRAFSDIENTATKMNVNGVIGLKYEHQYEGLSEIAIILPFREYKMILAAYKTFENDFKQILASFKFFATTTPETKTYRNEEWGFEFEYPEDWKVEENSFYSPFSKFNLQGGLAIEYNPLIPDFLINIVTPDFADNAVVSRQQRGVIESEFLVGGIKGTKYEYETEYGSKISIDLPFGEYRMIIAAYKAHEDIFNQILTSFKFLK